MKTMLGLALGILASAARLAAAGSLYPMEGGSLMREGRSLAPSSLSAPLHLAWSSAGCLGTPRGNPVVLSDRVIQTFQSGVQAVRRSDGTVLWTWLSTISDMWSPASYDADRDLLYQVSIQGALVALRPSDGQPMWVYSDGSLPAIFSYGGSAYFNGKIYFANGVGQFVCVDADSHSAVWRHNFPAGTPGADTPALDGGKIYIATESIPAQVACLDADTGSQVWAQSVGFSVWAAITLSTDKLYLMRNDGKVECRLRSNGSLAWSYQTMSWTLSNLALCGDLLIASSDDRNVYAISQATGQVMWQRGFVGNFARCAPIVVCGVIYISGCANQYYAMDGQSGKVLWTYNHADANDFVDWAEADGNLYTTDLNGSIYCFAPDLPGDPALCQCNLMAYTSTPTPVFSATATPTSLGSATASPTPTPSTTATPSSTLTQTRTFSSSPTASPSLTRTPSLTPSSTRTPTPQATFSSTRTASPTATHTPGTYDWPVINGPGNLGGHQCICYPNPVRHGSCHVAFQMAEPGKSHVCVYQATGEQVGGYSHEHSTYGLQSVPVDMHDYAPGVYFCKVDRRYASGKEDSTDLEKFIVLR